MAARALTCRSTEQQELYVCVSGPLSIPLKDGALHMSKALHVFRHRRFRSDDFAFPPLRNSVRHSRNHDPSSVRRRLRNRQWARRSRGEPENRLTDGLIIELDPAPALIECTYTAPFGVFDPAG